MTDDPPQIIINSSSSHSSAGILVPSFSAIRRTFCLLVLFDLIISTVLWIVYVKLKADYPGFTNEVLQYRWSTSLFDTVWLSAFRFICLILGYALLKSSKPWFVAMTTFVTCVFLIVKVSLYGFEKPTDPAPGSSTTAPPGNTALIILDCLVVVVSLVLAWTETWFMDLKVLPAEQKENLRLSLLTQSSETTPLLHPFLHQQRTHESFYSPAPSRAESISPYDSDDNQSFYTTVAGRTRQVLASPSPILTDSQISQYSARLKDALNQSWSMMDSDQWTVETGSNSAEGIVYSMNVPKYGKVFKLTAELDVGARILFKELIDGAANMPSWNPTVLKVCTLQRIDDNSDVSYNVAAEGAGGLVSSRDFVYLRYWGHKDDWFVTCSVSIEYKSMPQQPQYVRGEQGPTLMRVKDLTNNRTRIDWLLNTNLKGWLPQYLIDQALSRVIMDYLKNLRTHCLSLKAES